MKFRVIVILLGIISNCIAHDNIIDHAWQTSPSGVTISIRNKLMDDPYIVTFRVTNLETQKSVSLDVASGPNDWNQLIFPDDFQKCENIFEVVYKEKSKKFIWEAIVEGRLVLSGKFNYPNGEIIWTKHN